MANGNGGFWATMVGNLFRDSARETEQEMDALGRQIDERIAETQPDATREQADRMDSLSYAARRIREANSTDRAGQRAGTDIPPIFAVGGSLSPELREAMQNGVINLGGAQHEVRPARRQSGELTTGIERNPAADADPALPHWRVTDEQDWEDENEFPEPRRVRTDLPAGTPENRPQISMRGADGEYTPVGRVADVSTRTLPDIAAMESAIDEFINSGNVTPEFAYYIWNIPTFMHMLNRINIETVFSDSNGTIELRNTRGGLLSHSVTVLRGSPFSDDVQVDGPNGRGIVTDAQIEAVRQRLQTPDPGEDQYEIQTIRTIDGETQQIRMPISGTTTGRTPSSRPETLGTDYSPESRASQSIQMLMTTNIATERFRYLVSTSPSFRDRLRDMGFAMEYVSSETGVAVPYYVIQYTDANGEERTVHINEEGTEESDAPEVFDGSIFDSPKLVERWCAATSLIESFKIEGENPLDRYPNQINGWVGNVSIATVFSFKKDVLISDFYSGREMDIIVGSQLTMNFPVPAFSLALDMLANDYGQSSNRQTIIASVKRVTASWYTRMVLSYLVDYIVQTQLRKEAIEDFKILAAISTGKQIEKRQTDYSQPQRRILRERT